MKKVSIKKFENNEFSKETDNIVCEYPLTLFINNIEYTTLLCSPKDLKKLIFGFLFSEYLITQKNDVLSLIIDDEKGLAFVEIKEVIEPDFKRRYITSGCASSAVYYKTLDAIKLKPLSISSSIKVTEVLENMKAFNTHFETSEITENLEKAGVFDGRSFISLKDDITKQGAVDKVIGDLLENEYIGGNFTLYISAGSTSELVLKCAKYGICRLVSQSSPTDKAIKIAKKLNIILITIVSGQCAHVYSGFDCVED